MVHPSTSDTFFDRCNLHELRLDPTRAHNGVGEVASRRIASAESLCSACNFIDFTRVAPGVTIGQHTHRPDNEEFYLILEGTGSMRRNGQEFQVDAGDLIRNPPGGTHSLENTGAVEMQIFVFEVQVR